MTLRGQRDPNARTSGGPQETGISAPGSQCACEDAHHLLDGGQQTVFGNPTALVEGLEDVQFSMWLCLFLPPVAAPDAAS